MQLTDEQLGMLDVLMYEDGDGSGIFRGNGGKTLGEILDELDRSGYDFAASDELIDAIRNDPRLSDLVLADVDSYDERGAHAATFVENTADGGRNTYVAFQGTGTGETIDGQATNSEWYTDALGLEQSDTQPQREAREYVEYVAERYGSPVTVTGHSNGANKAMYVAATSDVVDRCVAFDGQGFSPAFFDKYADRIDENSDKVTFYGLEDDYVGPLMDLCQQKRGVLIDMKYLDDVRVDLHYAMPLGEIVYDFFDAIKSRSRGYASYDYEFKEYRQSDLVRLDFLLAGEMVDALSMIVFRDNAYAKGRRICEKLRDNIPRTLFEIPVQAAVGGKVIARETVKALRKDVLAKCYGGDITRKKKLLEKQKEGKKKMRQLGSVSLPSEAFTAVLKLDNDDD